MVYIFNRKDQQVLIKTITDVVSQASHGKTAYALVVPTFMEAIVDV